MERDKLPFDLELVETVDLLGELFSRYEAAAFVGMARPVAGQPLATCPFFSRDKEVELLHGISGLSYQVYKSLLRRTNHDDED